MVTMIAAVGKNLELGKNNDLLWHLPNDFKRFKTLTTGHHIIMGRKTFESLPNLLPNRTHIVITRNTNYKQEGVLVASSLNEALLLCQNDPQPFIIGGGEIYSLGLMVADKIELTHVDASFNADTFFPKIDLTIWEKVTEEKHEPDAKHAFPYSYCTYVRKEAS